MMATLSDNNSDESEEEIESNDDDIYRRKYQLLLERCEVLQQDNERLVHRAQQVKRLLRRGRRDRKLLMERLDKHGDNWRNVPITFELEEMLGFHPTKSAQNATSRSHFNSAAGGGKNSGSAEKPGRKSNSAGGAGTKRKASKADPNTPSAPKRRANANSQLNQDTRSLAHGNSGQTSCGNPGDPEIPKQEVARQIGGKWNTLPQEDKKAFYERHEKPKDKTKLFNNRAQTPSEDNPS